MEPLKPLKGRLWILIALLLSAVTCMLFLYNCPGDAPVEETPADTVAGDTINVAIELGPLTLTTQGDTLSGYYYDMLQDIARRHGLTVKYTPFSTADKAYQGLASGRFDMVIADQPVTAELRDQFIYTKAIAVDRQLLIQLPDSVGELKINSTDDLRNDSVWIAAGSQFKQRLINLSHEIGDTIFIIENPQYGAEQLVMLTAIGQIPRTVVNASAARRLLEHYPQLNADVEISFNQFQAWAINPNRTDLRDSLNIWLDERK